MATPPITLPFEAIDDLIYSARAGDIECLREDISKLSQENNCTPTAIIESAIDIEDESEGGTGACLLHWPAANGNIEILKYLLESLGSSSAGNDTVNASTPGRSPLINHPNNSGNTPLHWAALNTHLDCVKALVGAGADVKAKNDAGHDAAFLAERAEWSKQGHDVAPTEKNQAGDSTEESESNPPLSEGLQVVELLLESDKDNDADQNGPDADGGEGEDKMDGVSKTETG